MMPRKRSGFIDMGLALVLGAVFAMMAVTSSQATSLQIKNRMIILNRTESFYAGEVVAIASVFQLQTTPLPDGRTVLTIFNNSGG